MKLKTRDDERVFVLLLFVAVLLSLCFRGRMLLLLSYFLLLHRLKIFHFKGTLTCLSKNCRINSFTKQREYARVFSLSRTLSLSKRTATRSSLFEELKEADLFHSGEKRRIKRRERDTFKAAQSSEGNLKFSLWVTNSFITHRRDGDTR